MEQLKFNEQFKAGCAYMSLRESMDRVGDNWIEVYHHMFSPVLLGVREPTLAMVAWWRNWPRGTTNKQKLHKLYKEVEK
jgi:hypothetical protein